MLGKQKILAGRKAVHRYRTAHTKLHDKGWHKGISEEHTPLLKAMVNALEGLGFISAETDFEPKKTEVLAKFWVANDALIDNQLIETYDRVGECNDCGKCCLQCEYYDVGLFHNCKIYENRPEVCRNYPTIKQLLSGTVPTECSYKLVKKDPKSPEVELWR